jgi:subtilisin-like proprotein convertase family protein
MCAGGLADEKNPTQICAYLKYKAGWAQKVTPIEDEIQANIPADVNEYFIYSKNPAEYFIIENKQKAGRDKALPTSGLAIWHVDELGSNNNEQMTATEHYECALEQADNRFDLEHGTNRGDAEDLFNAPNHPRFANSTNPNSQWWDGTPSNLEIFEISAPGKVMTFRAKLLEDESSITLEESPGANIPDRDPQGIERSLVTDASGTLKDIAVSVNIAHTYIQDLIVALVSPAGTSVILHNRRGGSADNIIKTYTLANTLGLKALLNEPIQGTWKLKVADLAGQDLGKLNYWSLKISRKF